MQAGFSLENVLLSMGHPFEPNAGISAISSITRDAKNLVNEKK
ncbi:MAG: hypothetical protein ACFFCQ_05690 [Promethearchaeota archaeon]